MLGLLLGLLWLGVLWARLGALPGLDADALFLPELLQGLRQGHGLSHWLLPPAPSLFPDLGLLWAGSLGRDVAGAQRVYGLLMGAWFWLVLARVIRRCFDLPVRGSRALAAAGLLLALVATPAEGGLAAWTLPGHHGAAWVAGLALWAWTLRQEERPSRWGRTMGGAVLLGLLLASDRVFALWGLLPAALAALRLRGETQKRLLYALGLALLTAWAARTLLRADGARVAVLNLAFVRGRSPADWAAILALAPAFLRAHAWILAAAAAGVGLWAVGRPGDPPAVRTLLRAWLLAALASLGMAVVMGSFNGRYLYPLLLPAVLLPAWVAARSEAWSRAALLAPALAGLLWLATPAARVAEPAELRRSRALDGLLESRDQRWGWADYWHARPLRVLSGRGTVCLPMVTEGGKIVRYPWMVEEDLFARGAALERPQFVVQDGLDPAALTAALGPPREIQTVEGLTVWLYP